MCASPHLFEQRRHGRVEPHDHGALYAQLVAHAADIVDEAVDLAGEEGKIRLGLDTCLRAFWIRSLVAVRA